MTPVEALVTVRRGEQPPQTLQARGVPVLGANDELLDFVAARTLKTEPFFVLAPRSSLQLIVSCMRKLGVRVVLVCHNGKLRGLITVSDVIRVLNEEAPKASTRVSAAEAAEFELDSD